METRLYRDLSGKASVGDGVIFACPGSILLFIHSFIHFIYQVVIEVGGILGPGDTPRNKTDFSGGGQIINSRHSTVVR